MTQQKHVAFRVEKALADRLEQVARESERTVSQQLRVAIREHLQSYERAEGGKGDKACSR